jgi:hypothetical protein
MSSSSQPHPPYKSRLFNFLNRQYIRINDQIGKITRQLKLAVEWGLQTLLYPLYFLVQAGRMAGRQFNSNSKPSPLELDSANNDWPTSLPDVDLPIQTVLEAIATKNIPQPPKELTVKGLATMVANRHLVLVSTDNQIYDLLSPQQQQDLQLLIRDVRADYWEQKRLATREINPKINILPPLKSQQPELILPLKLFWQLMEWVRQSRVAIALNVFGESSSICSSQSNYPPEVDNDEPVSPPTGFLAHLDRTVAKLENDYFLTGNQSSLTNQNNHKHLNYIENDDSIYSQEQEKNFLIQILLKSAIEHFFGRPKNQTEIRGNTLRALPAIETKTNKNISSFESSSEPLSLPQQVRNIVNSIFKKIKLIINQISSRYFPEDVEQKNDPFKIQILIWAAIEYFFKPKNNALLSPNNLLKNTPENSHNILSSNNSLLEDPWLSWEDLYINNTYQEFVDEEKTEAKSNILDPKPKPNQTQQLPAKSQDNIDVVNKDNSVSNSIELNTEIDVNGGEYQPDWWETKATDLGYHKHILQIILEWLDKIILWLEDLLLKIWRWLRGIL